MNKCNWCGKYFKESPFSNYCSKKCEKEAVNNGERRGITSSNSKIFLIILIIMIIFYVFRNNDNKALENKKEKKVEQSVINDTPNKLKLVDSNEVKKTKNDSISYETVEKNDLNRDDSIKKETTDIAINLLKEGNSVKKVSDSTGLNKRDVRRIKKILINLNK